METSRKVTLERLVVTGCVVTYERKQKSLRKQGDLRHLDTGPSKGLAFGRGEMGTGAAPGLVFPNSPLSAH